MISPLLLLNIVVPETKIDLIIDYLEKIDLVLIMSVNPGFGGLKFMPEVLEKIRKLKKIQSENRLNFDIEIDGGINFDNCQLAIEAGANILVSGFNDTPTFFFKLLILLIEADKSSVASG